MHVLIVARTKMRDLRCIGGLAALGPKSVRPVRLLTAEGNNWPADGKTQFRVGQVWDMELRPVENCLRPHVEDHLVVSDPIWVRKEGKLGAFLRNLIEQELVDVEYGPIYRLFDKKLCFALGGSGYARDEPDLPDRSVGFWIPDRGLELVEDETGAYYVYRERTSSHWRIKYVGESQPVRYLPRETLLRVSLARWWKPEGADHEKRCYLMLSGWYF